VAYLRHEKNVEPQKSVNTAITQQQGKHSFLRAVPRRTALIARQRCGKHISKAANKRLCERDDYVKVEQAVFPLCVVRGFIGEAGIPKK
jgi:hypothetical protein